MLLTSVGNKTLTIVVNMHDGLGQQIKSMEKKIFAKFGYNSCHEEQ